MPARCFRLMPPESGKCFNCFQRALCQAAPCSIAFQGASHYSTATATYRYVNREYLSFAGRLIAETPFVAAELHRLMAELATTAKG